MKALPLGCKGLLTNVDFQPPMKALHPLTKKAPASAPGRWASIHDSDKSLRIEKNTKNIIIKFQDVGTLYQKPAYVPGFFLCIIIIYMCIKIGYV